MVRRLVLIILLAASIYTEKLVSWNEGYDRGYDHAMAEAFIHPTAPEARIKEIAGVK